MSSIPSCGSVNIFYTQSSSCTTYYLPYYAKPEFSITKLYCHNGVIESGSSVGLIKYENVQKLMAIFFYFIFQFCFIVYNTLYSYYQNPTFNYFFKALSKVAPYTGITEFYKTCAYRISSCVVLAIYCKLFFVKFSYQFLVPLRSL